MEHYSSRAGEQEGQPLSYSHNMGQRALSPPSTGRADARERPCIDQTLIMATPSLNNSMTMRASSPPGTGGEGRAPRAFSPPGTGGRSTTRAFSPSGTEGENVAHTRANPTGSVAPRWRARILKGYRSK